MRRVFVVIGVIAALLAVVPAALATLVKMRAPASSSPEDEQIELVAAMTSESFRSMARPLRGGRIMTFMGGADIDLREATLPDEGADLQVRNFMGGTEIIVPGSWSVQVRDRTVFGGTEDMTQSGFASQPGPALRIEVLNVAGGVEIAQEPSFDWDEPDDIAGIPSDA